MDQNQDAILVQRILDVIALVQKEKRSIARVNTKVNAIAEQVWHKMPIPETSAELLSWEEVKKLVYDTMVALNYVFED